MIITRVETLRLGEFGNVLWVKIHTDSGAFGLGETFMWPSPVEAHIHDVLAPKLLGRDPLAIDRLWHDMNGYLGFAGTGAETRAISAIDIALWDLWGRTTNQPVYQLLGGRFRDSIRTYNTCAGYQYVRNTVTRDTSNFGIPDDEGEGPYEDLKAFFETPAELAKSLLSEGITAMKIWPFDPAAEKTDGQDISHADLEHALMPFRKIREAVGNEIDIMVEMHSLWNVTTAIRIAKALEPYNPFWIEDPVRSNTLENLAQVRANTTVPITSSETFATRWVYRDAFEQRACDFAMPDICWTGGIGESKKIATLAETFGIPIAPHDCTGPVALAVSVHLCLNAPNAVIQESVRAFRTGWYREVAEGLPVVDQGLITVDDRPGHGVDLAPGLESRSDAIVRISSLD